MALAQRATVPHSRPTLANSVALGPGETTAWVMLVFQSAQLRNNPHLEVRLLAITADGDRHTILSRCATATERPHDFARAVKVIRYMKELHPVMYIIELHDPSAAANPVDVFSALLPSATSQA